MKLLAKNFYFQEAVPESADVWQTLPANRQESVVVSETFIVNMGTALTPGSFLVQENISQHQPEGYGKKNISPKQKTQHLNKGCVFIEPK